MNRYCPLDRPVVWSPSGPVLFDQYSMVGPLSFNWGCDRSIHPSIYQGIYNSIYPNIYNSIYEAVVLEI